MMIFGWICWIAISIAVIGYGFSVAFFFTLGKAFSGNHKGSFGQLVGVIIVLIAAYSFGMAVHHAPF